MPDRVAQHRHCSICGKATALKDETCSPDCATTLARNIRRKRQTFIAYVAVGMLLMVLLLFQGRGG